MKKIRKIFAVLLSLAMVLGMSMTTFAADPEKPTESDSALVTINDVEAGATFTAYQIIDAEYDTNGFNSYVWAEGINVNDTIKENEKVIDAKTQITDSMITDLAKDPTGLYKMDNFNPTVDKLTVGTWMILVTPPTENPDKVYNPMIVSVYYSVSGSDNTMENIPVSAKDNWKLNTTDAYAKSTKITIEKTITDPTEEKQEVGKKVGFTVKGTIPSYSSEYKSARYDITDTIINGLEYTADAPIVKVNGVPLTNGTEYEYRPGNGTFTISFKSDYILGLAAATEAERAVEITYSAKVTEDAITVVGENEVTVNYTTKPGDDSGAKKDTEYTFTFALDGLLKKVGEGDEVNGLAGAEFTLYRSYENEVLSDVFDSMTTTKDGKFDIEFKGLDGDLSYYLKETKAPTGYTINDTVYKITFGEIIKDKDGKVISYDVTILDTVTNQEVTSTISYGKPAETPAVTVLNTGIGSLPSTGGIGTTIFTIGGCLIMIVAAGLFFASRRKSAK